MGNKVKFYKNKGTIVFLGGMNAMPMMYALELKKEGFDVLYFVDATQDNELCRPENHFKDICYPYPDWIIELDVRSQIFLPMFRALFSYYIEKVIRQKAKDRIQVYILNGFFVSLSPYLNKSSNKVALAHGSDLHTWADVDNSNILSETFSRQSIFKYTPKYLSKWLIQRIVEKQFQGFLKCNEAIYFPKGFNSEGDKIVSKLVSQGVTCIERFDISFEALKGVSRSYRSKNEKLVIFSGVRFQYKTFTESNSSYSKGNDIIIRALAKYYKRNPNIEIHLVEKGPDCQNAKKLIQELGLDDVIVWHNEMKFTDLLNLYDRAHICFDQVGSHWIGAIGGYALWLGKPLIANDSNFRKYGFWPEDTPILSADSENKIINHLIDLEKESYREKISGDSKLFADSYLSPKAILNQYI
ncbi:glycosyltransferase [Vibrio lentus]|uniref:glycosyltransferase n=1 Tax=Vibrio lentus TaxID=136468 RepID=UPI000C83D946|nr:glycosyltransferase [Vibrio lentus]PMM56249.1 hypothetical protein BCT51_22965 [Vibrio lentus]